MEAAMLRVPCVQKGFKVIYCGSVIVVTCQCFHSGRCLIKCFIKTLVWQLFSFRERKLEVATLTNECSICMILFHSNNGKTSIIGSCPQILWGNLKLEPEGADWRLWVLNKSKSWPQSSLTWWKKKDRLHTRKQNKYANDLVLSLLCMI